MSETRKLHPEIYRRDSLFIGGRWQQAHATIDVVNPATENAIGTSASANATEVDAGVRAAAQAFLQWQLWSPTDRANILTALLEQLCARRDQLIETTVAEVGAPVSVARDAHVDLGLEIMADFADLVRTFEWTAQLGNSTLLRRPAGVVAAITPWNYPFYQLVAKVGAALAAGCTIVVKPAELTPLSSYLFADAAQAAGIPPGVFSLVPGSGAIAGAALANHPMVTVVSFTGSTRVGASIGAAAAAQIKRACLELGGKSASIVLDDADFSTAIASSVDTGMLNSGQTCSAWSRLIVPRERYEQALEVAAHAAAALRVGDPTLETTDIGPLISAAQQQSVTAAITGALSRGAREVTDHQRHSKLPARGYFVPPTVLADLSDDDPAAREEIFGPVITVHAHNGDDDAVRIANGTEYGLAGAVWSADTDRAFDIAARLDTGQVDINGAPFNRTAPFGGWKKSGLGREFGTAGIEEFVETTSIQM